MQTEVMKFPNMDHTTDDLARLDAILAERARAMFPPIIYKFNRKGKLRNKPCPCGSIKKFKQCCWDVLKEEK